MQESLFNRIAKITGQEYAREVTLSGKIPVMDSFTSAKKLINDNAKRVTLHRVCITKERSMDVIRWLLDESDGGFLVRLQRRNLDHVVCVDAKLRQSWMLSNNIRLS